MPDRVFPNPHGIRLSLTVTLAASMLLAAALIVPALKRYRLRLAERLPVPGPDVAAGALA